MRLILPKSAQSWLNDLHKNSMNFCFKNSKNPSQNNANIIKELLKRESNDPFIFQSIDNFLIQLCNNHEAWIQENLEIVKSICAACTKMYCSCNHEGQYLAMKFLPSILLNYFIIQGAHATMPFTVETSDETLAQAGPFTLVDYFTSTLEGCLLSIYNHAAISSSTTFFQASSMPIPFYTEHSIFSSIPSAVDSSTLIGATSTNGNNNNNGLRSSRSLNGLQSALVEANITLRGTFQTTLEINSENRYQIICLLIRLYAHAIHLMGKASHAAFCRLGCRIGGLREALPTIALAVTEITKASPSTKRRMSRFSKSTLVLGAKQQANNFLQVVKIPSRKKSNLSHKKEHMSSDDVKSAMMMATAGVDCPSLMDGTTSTFVNVNRISHVPQELMLELLTPLYYILFNGSPQTALLAINTIEQRAIYSGYDQISLVVNGIKNSLLSNPSGAPDDGPMGLSVALSSTLNHLLMDDDVADMFDNYDTTEKKEYTNEDGGSFIEENSFSGYSPCPSPRLSMNIVSEETMTDDMQLSLSVSPGLSNIGSPCRWSNSLRYRNVITNASFKAKKLPDDIPVVVLQQQQQQQQQQNNSELGLRLPVKEEYAGNVSQPPEKNPSKLSSQRWKQTKL